MRISSQQLLNSSIRAIQDQSVEAMKWQDQISSGKRYNAASQGMVALARGVEIAFDQSKFKMLKANQDFVATRMAMADSQLGSMIDAMGVIKEASDQAVNGSLGPAGFSALAAKARTAYEALAQMAVATNANDERILLSADTPARLSQPKTTVESPVGTTTAATIGTDAVFEFGGEYEITFVTDSNTGRLGARLQINGQGPADTSSSRSLDDTTSSPDTYFLGTLNTVGTGASAVSTIHFPQQNGRFFNLDLNLIGEPSTATTITFQANPVEVKLNGESRIHSPGSYQVELNKGDQFLNGDFEGSDTVSYEAGIATTLGWEATLGAGDNIALSTDTSTNLGASLKITTADPGANPSVATPPASFTASGPTVVATETVTLEAGDFVSFNWRADSDAKYDANVKLRNTVTGEEISLLDVTATADGDTTDWARATSSAITADQAGTYELIISTGVNATTANGVADFYIDDIQTTSTADHITKATLIKDGTVLDSITADDGIAYDSSTKITTLNFGDSAADPAGYYNLGYTIVGDPTNMRSTDRISVTVGSSLKQIEIEPGVWVDEGISFRDALGQGQGSSRDVLAAALAVVQRLEAAAETGVLADGFGTSVENLKSSTDQLVKYQVRSGLIGNRVDAAKAALEVKATELEAHRSRLLDTDIAEASAGLVRTQTLLEAARSIFARLESSNLFQRLM
jgi:flagellin-like hook-associated protein FlgL